MESLMRRALSGIDADYADIRIERNESTTVSFLGPILETIGSSFTLGGSVRVCIRGGWGFSAFTDLDRAAESAREASIMARLAAGAGTRLAAVDPVIAEITSPEGIDPAIVPLDDKVALASRYNSIMLAAPGIVTTSTAYRDSTKESWLHTTEGTMLHQTLRRAGVSLSATARDGANVQRGHRSFGDTRGYGTVLNREHDAEEVVRITRELIAAPKVEGGSHTVLLDPQLAGVFIHEAFGHLSEADFVYENPQAREMMTLNRRFGPDFLNVVDDGTLAGEAGYVPFDDEGVPGRRTHLIRNGLLVGRLHSRETASVMDESPTGNGRAISAFHRPIVRMTSTFIEGGDASLEELVDHVGNGIYACGFLGGNTDLERFTFSSAHAYRIENGKITTPVRDVILSGNVFETLHAISRIGNDRTLFGGLGGCGKGGQSPLPVSDGSAHLVVNNLLVG